MFMTAADSRESLRQYSPRVYCEGDLVECVADEARFMPGIDAGGGTYDYALESDYQPLMVAEQHTTGNDVNRMLHICRTPQDLINKLEAVRLMCREVGCAQRYLTHDALNAIFQATYGVVRVALRIVYLGNSIDNHSRGARCLEPFRQENGIQDSLNTGGHDQFRPMDTLAVVGLGRRHFKHNFTIKTCGSID